MTETATQLLERLRYQIYRPAVTTEADGALEKARGLPLWEPSASPKLV